MSKTFKSEEPDNRELEVGVLCGSPRLLVKDFDGDNKGFIFGKADAPALALAILEAAGVDSDLTWSGAKDYGNADHLGWIAGHLGTYIKTQERITAEAKEQAELEAEALELFNTLQTEIHGNLGPNWVPVTEFPNIETKRKWLAVARKAREMAKDATNGR